MWKGLSNPVLVGSDNRGSELYCCMRKLNIEGLADFSLKAEKSGVHTDGSRVYLTAAMSCGGHCWPS